MKKILGALGATVILSLTACADTGVTEEIEHDDCRVQQVIGTQVLTTCGQFPSRPGMKVGQVYDILIMSDGSMRYEREGTSRRTRTHTTRVTTTTTKTKPATQKPATQKPATQKPATQKPATQKPATAPKTR